MQFLAVLVTVVLFYLIYLAKKRGASFLVRVLIATLLGVVVGLVFTNQTDYVVIFGEVFINFLRAMVVPLLFFSITTTVIGLEDFKTLSSIGAKSVGFLASHNILGSITAIIIASIMGLGVGAVVNLPSNAEATEVPSAPEAIVNLFPRNIVDQMANDNVIPVIIFSAVIGFAVLSFKDRSQVQGLVNFLEAGNDVVFRIISFITRFTPYAVFSLIAGVVSTSDLSSLGYLIPVLIAVWIACFFHSFITTPGFIGLVARINPFTYVKKFMPTWLVAFSTQSSVGAIPSNVESQTNLGVPHHISSFTASFGTTFGMPGCAAIWPVLIVMFTVNSMGIDYGLFDYIRLIFVAVMVSAGTVGVPGIATVVATAVVTAVGLPVEMVVIMTPISAIADMARTATNVSAAGSTGVMVAASEGVLDRQQYVSDQPVTDAQK